MNKKTFYTVKEVADLLESPVSKVRYYVNRFKMDVPIRAGKLAFSEKHIRKLKKIHTLVDEEKYRLDGVAGNLRETEAENEQMHELLEKLLHIKQTLNTLRAGK